MLMRFLTVVLCCVCVQAVAAQSDGIRPDIPTLLDKNWEGVSTFELVRRIQDDLILLQPEQTKKQWGEWRNAINKDKEHQRELLLKSGLLESATGDCKLALQEIALLLEPVQALAKRFDRAMKREKNPQLENWKPIYALIMKEDYLGANEKLKDFQLDAVSTQSLKTIFERMMSVMKERVAQPLPEKKGEEEKK